MKELDSKCEKDILCGINLPKDKNNLTDLEKKHLPNINVPDKVKKDEVFLVSIKIGGIDKVEHPNEINHFIEWLELYVGDTFLGRAQFSAGLSYASSKFNVKLSYSHGPIKVRAKCNLHGLWENVKNIEVV